AALLVAVGVARYRAGPSRAVTLPSWFAVKPRAASRTAVAASSSRWAISLNMDLVDDADDDRADGQFLLFQDLADAVAFLHDQHRVAGPRLGQVHGQEVGAHVAAALVDGLDDHQLVAAVGRVLDRGHHVAGDATQLHSRVTASTMPMIAASTGTNVS